MYTVTKLGNKGASWSLTDGGRYRLGYTVQKFSGPGSSQPLPMDPIEARNAVYDYEGVDPFGTNTYANNGWSDANAYLVSVDSESGDSDRIFTIFLNFEYIPYGDINPVLQATRINFSVSPVGEEVVYRDVYGYPILNSAGQLPVDPLVRPVYKATLSLSRYFNSVPAYLAYMADCTNADWFFGFGPGQVLCMDFTSSDMGINPSFGRIFDVTANFQISPQGWATYVRNAGNSYYESGQLKFPTVNGERDDTPVLLAMNGSKLPPGAPPMFLKFELHNQLPFGGIF